MELLFRGESVRIFFSCIFVISCARACVFLYSVHCAFPFISLSYAVSTDYDVIGSDVFVYLVLHLNFGLPLGLFPVGLHLSTFFIVVLLSLRSMWPNHLSLCFLMILIMSSSSRICSISAFVSFLCWSSFVLMGPEIVLNIYFPFKNSQFSSLLFCQTYSFRGIGSDWSYCHFVCLVIYLPLSIRWKLHKASFPALIRSLISLFLSFPPVIVTSRHLNSSTS